MLEPAVVVVYNDPSRLVYEAGDRLFYRTETDLPSYG